jgi:hypothetical protein
MKEFADVVTGLPPTSEPSAESVAIETLYLTAPTIGFHESKSAWEGNETEAPFAGVSNCGA